MPAKRGTAGSNGLANKCWSLDRRSYTMAMKFLLVLNPLAARLAFCSNPFMASTNALLRPCCMPAITPSKCVLSVRVSRLKGLQATSHRPADPALQPFWDHIRAVTVLHHFVHLALRHLQVRGPSILQIRVLQGVHRLHMPIRPGTHGACASPSSGCDGWPD
jgi:hypothetical protein